MPQKVTGHSPKKKTDCGKPKAYRKESGKPQRYQAKAVSD